MTVEIIRDVLAWCSVINVGILLFWWLWFMLGHDFMYRLHGKWFKLSVEKFDATHYSLMGFFKIGILLFNIVPYLALRIVE
jgi:hypothetical protein